MEGGSVPYNPRTVEEVFKDFKSRRGGILKALTTDVDDFYQQCDPEKENLCLYGFPNGSWEVNLPAEEVPPELPEPALGINFARDGMQEKDWICLVAVHSDAWLLAVAFYFGARFGFDKNDRRRLFNMINEIPTIFEVVTGIAKRPAKEKSTGTNSSSKSKTGGKMQRSSESQMKMLKTPPPKDEDDEEDEEDEDEHGDTLCGACGENYASDEFWICCDICEKWFHGVTSTVGLMKSLTNLYEKPSASNKVYLMKKLFSSKMHEGGSASCHLNDFRSIVNQLKSVDIPFDDEVKELLFLCSLPNSWDSLVMTVSNTLYVNNILKFDDVVSKILNEEIHRKSTEESSSRNALHVESRGKKKERSKSINTERGTDCGSREGMMGRGGIGVGKVIESDGVDEIGVDEESMIGVDVEDEIGNVVINEEICGRGVVADAVTDNAGIEIGDCFDFVKDLGGRFEVIESINSFKNPLNDERGVEGEGGVVVAKIVEVGTRTRGGTNIGSKDGTPGKGGIFVGKVIKPAEVDVVSYELDVRGTNGCFIKSSKGMNDIFASGVLIVIGVRTNVETYAGVISVVIVESVDVLIDIGMMLKGIEEK
ncbi:hypothetical protein KI387_018759 [Taxus chinensis]|uniref:Alfin N-terminal domain-containing protein n=1 Tax=Taxus chinensis TaxID=29808 RepID=A0AA38G8L0_TAXCH|nr:hypothetical protein KI387_018759 [Taxus chinensis]